jgi:hypothetical protein
MPTPTTAVVLSFRDAALRRPIDTGASRGSRRFPAGDSATAADNVIPLAAFRRASRRFAPPVDLDPLPGGEAA